MKIGFIGAGKAGFTLGKYFAESGKDISGYFSRSRDSAAEAARLTGSKAFENIPELVENSDTVFITTPDYAVKEIYNAVRELDIRGKMICHCSGALSSQEAFPDIEEHGAQGYSIHPLFPISSKYESWKQIDRAYFCIEGDSRRLEYWKAFFEKLGNPVKILSAEHKIQYHAACAAASNLVCALIAESTQLLSECGFTQKQALSALEPLITANLSSIIKTDPVSALTGPVERCDCETVLRHLTCFESDTDRELYRAASQKLILLAKTKHPETDYSELENILGIKNK